MTSKKVKMTENNEMRLAIILNHTISLCCIAISLHINVTLISNVLNGTFMIIPFIISIDHKVYEQASIQSGAECIKTTSI